MGNSIPGTAARQAKLHTPSHLDLSLYETIRPSLGLVERTWHDYRLAVLFERESKQLAMDALLRLLCQSEEACFNLLSNCENLHSCLLVNQVAALDLLLLRQRDDACAARPEFQLILPLLRVASTNAAEIVMSASEKVLRKMLGACFCGPEEFVVETLNCAALCCAKELGTALQAVTLSHSFDSVDECVQYLLS
jgi:hypothetical protein